MDISQMIATSSIFVDTKHDLRILVIQRNQIQPNAVKNAFILLGYVELLLCHLIKV